MKGAPQPTRGSLIRRASGSGCVFCPTLNPWLLSLGKPFAVPRSSTSEKHRDERIRRRKLSYRRIFTGEPRKRYGDFGQYGAELQVRTLAQDLWAEMAHELSYKSIFVMLRLICRRRIDRRIYILSALVESADMEFSRINRHVANAPGAEQLNVLRTLETQFFKHVSRPYDLEMSVRGDYASAKNGYTSRACP